MNSLEIQKQKKQLYNKCLKINCSKSLQKLKSCNKKINKTKINNNIISFIKYHYQNNFMNKILTIFHKTTKFNGF